MAMYSTQISSAPANSRRASESAMVRAPRTAARPRAIARRHVARPPAVRSLGARRIFPCLPKMGGGEGLLASADAAVRRGEVEQAVRQLERAVRLHPRLQPAYARLAELTGAAHAYVAASDLAPDDVAAAAAAGYALQREGEWGGAIELLQRATRLKPGSADLVSDLGTALRQAGHAREGDAA